MSIVSDSVLKTYFNEGDYPTEQQFVNLIDSKRHVSDDVPAADISGLDALFDMKVDILAAGVIPDAETSHATDSWATVNSALDALGTKINSIIAAIQAV